MDRMLDYQEGPAEEARATVTGSTLHPVEDKDVTLMFSLVFAHASATRVRTEHVFHCQAPEIGESAVVSLNFFP